MGEGLRGLIYLHKRISYPQVVSRVKATNCILEILQNNQQAQSLRYFEAIVYNKKLLTNNRRITELSYCDECYMKVFSSLDEIDIEWVRKKENVDYGYKGEFSPISLVDHVEGYHRNSR